jgi:hypothetical protein
MMINEKIGKMIGEVEKARYPEDKDAYKKIADYISGLKRDLVPLYNLMEVLKQLDNIERMMYNYLPKQGYYDFYGSKSKADTEWNYNHLAREKKRLLKTLSELRSKMNMLE